MTKLIPPAPPENNTPLFLAGAIAAVSGFVAMVLSGNLQVDVSIKQKEKH